MQERLVRFFVFWAGLLIVMTIFRILFVFCEPVYTVADLLMLPEILWHGLPMDLSMSAYLMVVPGIVLTISIWVRRSWLATFMHWYIAFVAFLVGFTAVLDAALYPYWGFRLDSTPLFYFFTSPGAAMASLPLWAEALWLIAVALVVWGLTLALRRLWYCMPAGVDTRKPLATVVMTLLTIGLIIPIRGGVTVSTMTTGRGFFSTDMRLNQATINPLFSLIYSLTHIDDIADSFRFFDDARTEELYADLCASAVSDEPVPTIGLRTDRPDIYIVILESFSAGLMPSLGGESVAVNLDRLATDEGVLFTDFYAESFRTDRALPVILSGYPGMSTASPMRYTNRLGAMPGLASTLSRAGWSTKYVYGGDADFTNMKAYLVATGFETIISDVDFPMSERLSKWGAHDDKVFERALRESAQTNGPVFMVIQTSSSHEPFEVPYSKFDNPKKNAFAYADACLGDFVSALKSSGRWENSLLVIVPDHWGAYPEGLTGYTDRHHVPLVITGGAVTGASQLVDVPSSQSDIAPTLLGLLDVDAGDFVFGKNVFDPASPRFAWLTEPDWFALVTPSGLTAVTIDGTVVKASDDAADGDRAKAFIRMIYKDFAKR